MRKRITWLGLVIAALGLGLGFLPMSSSGVSCGSAFAGGGDALGEDYFNATYRGLTTDFSGACSDTLQTWRIVAIALIVLGLAIAVVLITRKSPEPQQAEQPEQPSVP